MGSEFLQIPLLLPICLSLAVIGQVWIWIYQPNWGLINTVLRLVHLDQLTIAWLGKHKNALAVCYHRLVMAADRAGNGNFPGWINIHSFRINRGS